MKCETRQRMFNRHLSYQGMICKWRHTKGCGKWVMHVTNDLSPRLWILLTSTRFISFGHIKSLIPLSFYFFKKSSVSIWFRWFELINCSHQSNILWSRIHVLRRLLSFTKSSSISSFEVPYPISNGDNNI